MKRYRITGAAALALLALAAPAQAQEEPGRGEVSGRILDQTSEEPLFGAEVELSGTRLSTFTDRGGRYRLPGVPPGEHRLVISYLGFESLTFDIAVEPGETLVQDAAMSVAFSEAVMVVAEPLALGQARALNQQKSAPNIVNVVAADQIGSFPDPNVAEAAGRVPGIVLQRDDGEGENVIVRGIQPELNSVTINGERIPSTSNTSRTVDFISVSSEILQGIEVTKAITPDMDADAIGGVVNLVTKQAPEERLLEVKLEGGYNELQDEPNSRGSFTFGRRFAENRLGLVLSGSGRDQERGNDRLVGEYDDGELDDLQLVSSITDSQRYSFNSALDWLYEDGSSAFLRGTYTRQDQDAIRRRARYRRIQRGIGDDGGRIERDVRDRERRREIYSLSAGGQLLVDDRFELDLRGSFSASRREEPGTYITRFRQSGVEFSPPRIDDYRIDIAPIEENFDQSGFRFAQLEDLDTTDEDLTLRADGLYYLPTDKVYGTLKFGAKARFKTKDNEENRLEFDGDVDNLGSLIDDFSDPDWFEGLYPFGRFQSPDLARELIEGGQLDDRSRLFDRDTLDYEAEEDVFALYGMTELNLSPRLSFLAGVRYERTDTSFVGTEVLFDAEGDFAGTQPVAGESDYDNLLPMAHLRWALGEDTNLRFAVTTSLARPAYFDLVPFRLVNEEDSEIRTGNPRLDPTTAINLDVLFEHYFTTVGLIGGGVFYKELDDPIVDFRTEQVIGGEEFEVTQPRNFESGEIFGVEVFYQNQLRFLPAPFDGLGVYANYTYTDSEATVPGREDLVFPLQAEHGANFALSYEKRGFSGRVAFSYAGKYLREIGDEASEDELHEEYEQWDLLLSQQLNARVRLFLSVLNLDDARDRQFLGSRAVPIRDERYSWWGSIGVAFRID